MQNITHSQAALLVRAQTATFGQLRQQHLNASERQDCSALVGVGLMKDVLGTTFMLTDAGSRHQRKG